jgi:hypothetical protein
LLIHGQELKDFIKSACGLAALKGYFGSAAVTSSWQSSPVTVTLASDLTARSINTMRQIFHRGIPRDLEDALKRKEMPACCVIDANSLIDDKESKLEQEAEQLIRKVYAEEKRRTEKHSKIIPHKAVSNYNACCSTIRIVQSSKYFKFYSESYGGLTLNSIKKTVKSIDFSSERKKAGIATLPYGFSGNLVIVPESSLLSMMLKANSDLRFAFYRVGDETEPSTDKQQPQKMSFSKQQNAEQQKYEKLAETFGDICNRKENMYLAVDKDVATREVRKMIAQSEEFHKLNWISVKDLAFAVAVSKKHGVWQVVKNADGSSSIVNTAVEPQQVYPDKKSTIKFRLNIGLCLMDEAIQRRAHAMRERSSGVMFLPVWDIMDIRSDGTVAEKAKRLDSGIGDQYILSRAADRIKNMQQMVEGNNRNKQRVEKMSESSSSSSASSSSSSYSSSISDFSYLSSESDMNQATMDCKDED